MERQIEHVGVNYEYTCYCIVELDVDCVWRLSNIAIGFWGSATTRFTDFIDWQGSESKQV